jgi:hypothetical protein
MIMHHQLKSICYYSLAKMKQLKAPLALRYKVIVNYRIA